MRIELLAKAVLATAYDSVLEAWSCRHCGKESVKSKETIKHPKNCPTLIASNVLKFLNN